MLIFISVYVQRGGCSFGRWNFSLTSPEEKLVRDEYTGKQCGGLLPFKRERVKSCIENRCCNVTAAIAASEAAHCVYAAASIRRRLFIYSY